MLLLADDPEHADAMAMRSQRKLEWRQELERGGLRICDTCKGFVDIPVHHPHIGHAVMVCVGARSQKAHLVSQYYDLRKGFWDLS